MVADANGGEGEVKDSFGTLVLEVNSSNAPEGGISF